MLPPGAQLLSNFISCSHASELLGAVDRGPWLTDLRRRVQHYGWRYDYRARRTAEHLYLGPLPVWLTEETRRLVKEGGFSSPPDQAIINEYLPGQGISAHVDCEPCFGPVIASLSLGGPCEMEFRSRDGGERCKALLSPRSLLILNGEARYDWTHAIPARKSDLVDGRRIPRHRRVSLTFRTVLRA